MSWVTVKDGMRNRKENIEKFTLYALVVRSMLIPCITWDGTKKVTLPDLALPDTKHENSHVE